MVRTWSLLATAVRIIFVREGIVWQGDSMSIEERWERTDRIRTLSTGRVREDMGEKELGWGWGWTLSTTLRSLDNPMRLLKCFGSQ